MTVVRTRNDIVFFWVSLFILIYFTFLYLDFVIFKIHSILLDVFRELITFPLVFGQFVLLILLVVQWKKIHWSFNIYYLASAAILMVTILFTLWSFFVA